MKNIIFLVVALIAIQCAQPETSCEHKTCHKKQQPGSSEALATVNKLFIAADSHNWDELKTVFNDSVLLDYTSLSGGEPATLAANQIIDGWKGTLPGFDATHHQLGNYLVNMCGDTAKVFCYGTATHFLANPSNKNTWTVVGTYNLNLIVKDSAWRVTKMKFNLKFIDGNPDIPKLAQEKMNRK